MKSLIIGGTGQYGINLTNHLINKGEKIFITSRNLKNKKNIKNVKIFKLNIFNKYEFFKIYNKIIPDKIFYFASQSSVKDSFDKPELTFKINYLGCKYVLKYLDELKFKGKFLNACSSEMYGNNKRKINPKSEFNPISPYAKSKVLSYEITKNYRKKLKTYNAILFNTESIYRSKKFVFTKIAISIARALVSRKKIILKLGNLDISRDWGWCEEYVVGINKMLSKKPCDLIFASGKTYNLNKLINYFLKYYKVKNLKIIFSKKYYRPNEIYKNYADISNTTKILKWKPKMDAKKSMQKLIEFYFKKFKLKKKLI